VVQSGGVDVIVQALLNFPQHAEVQLNGSAALANIAFGRTAFFFMIV
jgi:hypothetical protein